MVKKKTEETEENVVKEVKKPKKTTNKKEKKEKIVEKQEEIVEQQEEKLETKDFFEDFPVAQPIAAILQKPCVEELVNEFKQMNKDCLIYEDEDCYLAYHHEVDLEKYKNFKQQQKNANS